jgi:hypothetical protein
MFTRAEMANSLLDGPVSVTFTKKNGDERYMYCTTNMNLIPEEKLPQGKYFGYDDADIIRAFDLFIQEWRSFKVSSVIEFCPELINEEEKAILENDNSVGASANGSITINIYVSGSNGVTVNTYGTEDGPVGTFEEDNL